ncbi:ATP-binding cassette domain-containing protein [Dysgonomonas mossii]|uniref:ATP-binding cassette domain-containing protein n=1 Tax=Dysgonomonas mossii TaxID=163665 RepID=A0A4Y9IKS9_9BACT|nr:ATP-binding cassette domain-containing protein [Dysgonomonas mossii]MBF0762509.1 ATP-binding cassette domain-containing protein [Dysgonomonas mossii]TFU87174.1 ATP-binding cassette domain-containing protein [Dysgonomonas mossii]
MIQIEHISKTYGNQVALSDVNFSIQKSDIVGLLGVNGAGKSTLMKILAGGMTADIGRVTFSGEDILSNPLAVKKRIGYLSEDNPLYEDMYVKEYLEYVAGIYKVGHDAVSRVIEEAGLEREYKKKIKALSKGNRQRVGIAQALVHNPEFLILDEATSGLDPNQRESLNALFKELSKDKMILFSTHILFDVKAICSRVIFLDKGKLLIDKNIDEIDSIENTFHTLTNENNS